MILISAGDSLTAKLIKEANFDGIWISGFEASARLGLADNGSITLTEMLNIARPIVEVGLPVYVDVDTGYGSFKRTVKEFKTIGVVGVCIEDNLPEFKTNSLWGEQIPLMEIDDFCKKIDIPNKLQIIARTEALIRGYDDEVFKRLKAYRKAGANILLPHSRTKPLKPPEDGNIYAIVPTKFPEYTNLQLQQMGYDMIIWANQTERTKIKAIRDMLSTLKKHDRMLEAEKELCVTLDDMKGLTEA